MLGIQETQKLFENILKNPAFIGVIGVVIGSFLSLFGTILSQLILSKKEQKQWENQQAAENKSWTRNEQKKEKEYLREIYQNSLRSLSLFIALENHEGKETNGTQKLEIIGDIHKWVTMLLLRHSSSNLDNALNSFTSDPDEYRAKPLRTEIIYLSNNEEGFFLNKLKDIQEITKKDQDPNIRHIQISIDNDFRKQQLIEGIEIPQSYTFKFKLSEMSKSQREKLAECFFKVSKTIPSRLRLYVPIHRIGVKQIEVQGKQWQANLNPNSSEPQEIFNSWESDYEKYFKEAESSLIGQQNK